ncbi:SH3 domain-containing protein [Kovacikia minuta CCNUW1]|uniref:SH3 domain-containing protein n=1 Tax=Kovacikia minuta TaxID=2931930 RepID=UPI001CCAC677|nr:SH3 domain-containing protein [Kovacikia minuta]UBF26659.1 SH3 domain-containing protein [Kovacikia minuta CCNUW1]
MKRKSVGLLVFVWLAWGLGGCDLLRTISQQSQPSPQPTDTNQPSDGNTVPTQGNTTGSTSRPAVISGAVGSTVNIRSQPSSQASVLAYGKTGDQVYVQRQQQGNDGNTWYYVQYTSSNVQGWVPGNRIQFPSPPPPNNPITFNTALDRCRQQAQAELPNANIQVSQGWIDMNGRFVVNWSADSGAYGTCTVDRNGWVTSFVNTYQNNNPPNNSITQAALNGCSNRAANQLNIYPSNISVQQSAAYADGTFGVDWWSSNGRSGYCRVTNNGNVLSFVINDRPSAGQVALDRCRRRAQRELPGSQIWAYLDPRNIGSGYKVIWSANTGEDGYCRTDQNGNIIEFVNSQNGGNNFRCVGNMFGDTPSRNDDTEFRAFYDTPQFTRIEFRNLQTDYRYMVYLQPAGQNQQGQPTYQGTQSGGPSSIITLTDLSGGNPYQGSQVSLFYNGAWGRGTCRSLNRN